MALSRLRHSAIRRAPYLLRNRPVYNSSRPPPCKQLLRFFRSASSSYADGAHGNASVIQLQIGVRCYSSAELPEHVVLQMPALSPTMSQGNISKWIKKEGDKIAVGDVLCEIETDKATLEFESLEEGFLAKILVPEGSKDVPVGQPIAVTVENHDAIARIPKTFNGSEAKREPSIDQTATLQAAGSSELPPHIVLVMPALSPTMNQGNIVKWRKKEGDKIDIGDIICDIETDKATLEYESLEEGFLAKILVPEGTKEVVVGQPIAITVEDQGDIEDIKTSSIGHDSNVEAGKPVGPSHGKDAEAEKSIVKFNRISPAAKLLLAKYTLDASSISASGPHGTLLKGDVLTAIKSGEGSIKVSSKKAENLVSTPLQSQTLPKSSTQQQGAYDDLPNTQIRKVIAARLLESKQSIPHLYLSTDVVLDSLLALRKEFKEKYNIKVSVNDIVVKAVAVALKNVPEANAYWDLGKHEIVLCDSVDISIAVATEKGLMTPIVRNADQKSISSISSEVIKELAEKARAGKLKPIEFQGGTFSISNLGMFPVDSFCAIINPPQ
ncbi:hypothetical protein M569_13092, partial [Genlisea aurea]